MLRVKVCGITNLDDALAAVQAGADALGFIFAPSPRRVTPQTARRIIAALPPLVQTVGVFVNQSLERVRRLRSWCGLHWVQLHGDESPDYARRLGRGVIKTLAVGRTPPQDWERFAGTALLLDTWTPQARGGSGQSFDWRLAAPLARCRPVILAGGLDPDNLPRAVAAVRPYAVDVCSGVEQSPGRKDHAKLREFIALAKGL